MTPCFVSSMVSLARTNSAKRCFAARLSLEVFCVLSLAAALWILDGSGHRRSNVKLRHSPFLPFIRLCVFFHCGQIARLGRERGFAIGVVACNGHGERHPPAVWLKKNEEQWTRHHLLHSHGRTKHLHPTKYAARNGAHQSPAQYEVVLPAKSETFASVFCQHDGEGPPPLWRLPAMWPELTLQAGWMPFLCCDVDSFTSSVLQVRCAKAYVRQTCADIADEA